MLRNLRQRIKLLLRPRKLPLRPQALEILPQ